MKTDNRAKALKLYKQSLLNKKEDTVELEKKIRGIEERE
jgi:hypothetical protein